MRSIYDDIYEKAKPYLDTRENDVHVALSYDFARRLVTCYPEADPGIVLPAILLHDVGWKMIPEEKQLNAFGPKANDKETQRFHELEGVRIAGEILKSLDYSEEKTREILAIIDGHDTRLVAQSLHDALVKDADKLWRFTPTGVDIARARFRMERERLLDRLVLLLETALFTPHGRDMARKALDEVCNSP